MKDSIQKIVFVLIIIISININAQCDEIRYKGNNYPAICVKNLIKMFNMSRSQWKSEMQKYDFTHSGISKQPITKGLPFYMTTGQLLEKGFELKIAKGYDKLIVENAPLRGKKRSLFNNILNELESYFIKSDKGMNFFGFRYTDGYYYTLVVMESENIEIIQLTKGK